MTSHRLPMPIPLSAPWPVRIARAAVRALAGLRGGRAPADAGFADWDARMLDDIGAPPEWRRGIESEHVLRELERARWRMHGMHAPLGSDRY